ncbi:hypothetical protein [Klebsiella pneumoniae]|uniref:hypothetical protein n=1 Tax=Klebsiella pneumoniae TaxID=573 RepID=UPI0024BEDB2C|nr:hypothetical protein [Klebsiella pneumoniae]
MPGLNRLIIKPESDGATINQGLVVVAPVGDFELLLCHGTASIVRIMRDLILQLTEFRFIQQSRLLLEINHGVPALHLNVSGGDTLLPGHMLHKVDLS